MTEVGVKLLLCFLYNIIKLAWAQPILVYVINKTTRKN